jgi:hypothetical protein
MNCQMERAVASNWEERHAKEMHDPAGLNPLPQIRWTLLDINPFRMVSI